MEPQLITTLENFQAKHVEQGRYELLRGEYAYGGTAIMARTEEGEPAFVVSVYLDDLPLPPGEFWVKTWSENEGIGEELIRRGIIRHTGEKAESGFIVALSAELTEGYR